MPTEIPRKLDLQKQLHSTPFCYTSANPIYIFIENVTLLCQTQVAQTPSKRLFLGWVTLPNTWRWVTQPRKSLLAYLCTEKRKKGLLILLSCSPGRAGQKS